MAASLEQSEAKLARAAKLYEIVKGYAERGEPCPTNRMLADRFMLASTSKISDAFSFLHIAGMIEVKRMSARRIVTITATGKSTAGEPGKPHWSALRNAA